MSSKKLGKAIMTLVPLLLLALTVTCAPSPKTTSPVSTPVPQPKVIEEEGIIEIQASNSPLSVVSSAILTITRIEVLPFAENASMRIDIPLAVSSLDLVKLATTTQTLGSLSTKEGRYGGIRITVETLKVDKETATLATNMLRVTSPFQIVPGNKTRLILNFGGDSSFTKTSEGKFLFQPILIPRIALEKIRD